MLYIMLYALGWPMDWKNDFHFIYIGKLWFFWRKTCAQDVVSVKSFRFSIVFCSIYSKNVYYIFSKKLFHFVFLFLLFILSVSLIGRIRGTYTYLCYIILHTAPVFIKFQKHQTIRVPESISIDSLRGFMGVTNNLWTQ